MNTLAVRHWLALLGASWIPLLQAGDPPATGAPERTLSSEEARQYFKMVETLNPKFQGVDLFWQLQDRYGEQASYPVSEVITLVDPGALDKMVDQPMPPVPTGRRKAIPFGAFSHDEVKQYFAVLGEKDLAQGKTRVDRLGALYQKYGEQPWYTAREIRDIEKNLLRTVQLAAPSGVKPRPPTGWRPVFRGFHCIKIRSDWTDLLASEDRSQTDTIKAKTMDDLVGAKLSYSRDGRNHTDTLSIVGAVIVPFTWRKDVEYNQLKPVIMSVAPSVSVDKVDTNADPKNEVDYVYYRVGLYGKWLFKQGDFVSTVQMRAAYVYATDTSGNGRLSGGEFDVEPQMIRRGTSGEQFSIGFKNTLIPKIPVKEDNSDDSLVDCQIRAWIHAEIGDVQRSAAKWETVDGSFIRAGPTVQMQLNFPELLRGVSLTSKYSYLQPFRGPERHNNSLKLSAAFTLAENEAQGQKISLTAEYLKGSLILSKQYVETTTVGLSLIY